MLTVHDVSNIYHVPLMLDAQGAAQIIAKRLNLALPFPAPRLALWRGLADGVDTVSKIVRIALVGKYTGLQVSGEGVGGGSWFERLPAARTGCSARTEL